MKIEDLNLDVRTYNAVKRAGCTTVEELRQRMADDPDDLRRNTGSSTFDRIEEMLAGMQEPQAAVIVSEDYTRAVTLTRSIIANAQAAQQSLYEVCKGLKEMRDGKLYKELGYQNFEEYTENEVGIGRRHAYRYLSIAEGLEPDFVTSMSQIGTTKLALLAKLDEPTREAVTETVDVESVTVRELRNEINRITSENADLGQKLDAAQETIANKDRQFRAAMDSKNRELECVNESKKHSDEIYKKKHAEWVRAQNENAALTAKISDLEDQIKELENRPVEVAVSVEEVEEIERLNAELNEAKQELEQAKNEANRLASEAIRNMRGCHESEMEALRNQYERDLEKARKLAPDASELNKACFDSFRKMFEDLVDEIEIFLEDLHDDPRIEYVNRLDNYWTDNILYLKRKGEGAGA